MTSLYKVVDNGDLDVVEGLLDLAAAGKRVTAAAASRGGGRQTRAGAALVVVFLPHVGARFGGN